MSPRMVWGFSQKCHTQPRGEEPGTLSGGRKEGGRRSWAGVSAPSVYRTRLWTPSNHPRLGPAAEPELPRLGWTSAFSPDARNPLPQRCFVNTQPSQIRHCGSRSHGLGLNRVPLIPDPTEGAECSRLPIRIPPPPNPGVLLVIRSEALPGPLSSMLQDRRQTHRWHRSPGAPALGSGMPRFTFGLHRIPAL